MSIPRAVVSAFLMACPLAVSAGDWNQWRGPHRDGSDRSTVALRESLPAGGLSPLWISEAKIQGGGNGGWSSPIVVGDKVYCFSHVSSPRMGVNLPPEAFPSLKEERKAEMTREEIAEYEGKRNVEQKERREQQYRFDETVYCLDARTGKTLWDRKRESVHTGFRQSGTPAVFDGRLYYLGADRRLVCLNADTGEEHWSTELPVARNEEQVSSSVAVVDGVAVVLAGNLVGTDARTGQVLWKGKDGRMTGQDSSPTVWMSEGKSLVVANVNGSETVCVDPKSGDELWREKTHASRSTPVIAGDRMITLGDNRKNGLRCFSLSRAGAELEWTWPQISDPGSSPVVIDGNVYVQGENRLACVNLETGKPMWRTTLDLAQPRYTSLVAADRKVYFAFDGILCFAADPEEYRSLFEAKLNAKGNLASTEFFRNSLGIAEIEQSEKGQEEAQRVWQREIGQHGPLNCASPALCDGKLYIRRNHNLVCYDLRAETIQSE